MRALMRHGVMALSGLVAAGVMTVATPAAANHIYFKTWDDFQGGFTEVGTHGPNAKWFHFSAGPFVGNDGITSTSLLGLHVRSAGTHPHTGKPAFTLTVAQEDDDNGGLPGGVDHVKWLAYTNSTASSGFPGFDATSGNEVSCLAIMSGRLHGVANHPFKSAVKNPNADYRLASFALNTIDFDTFMVYDFFLTNNVVYALYERLPFGRPVHGNYAAFTHAIPLVKYHPNLPLLLRIGYDKDAGVVRWYINEQEMFRVDQIGMRLPTRQFLTIDHGGEETLVSPDQITCGMGMFTLLDAYRPSQKALVKLSSEPGAYFHPELGEPAPLDFVDEESLESSRLWGQGGEFRVLRYWVSSLPSSWW